MASPTPPASILAALNCRDNIHLVIGTNPLAATRCGQSLNAGAHPILIAPEGSELHYSLQKRVDDGSVKWEKKIFEDEDLLRLGREEVGGVVDGVFVTSGPRDPTSESPPRWCELGFGWLINLRLSYLSALQTQSYPSQRR